MRLLRRGLTRRGCVVKVVGGGGAIQSIPRGVLVRRWGGGRENDSENDQRKCRPHRKGTKEENQRRHSGGTSVCIERKERALRSDDGDLAEEGK